MERPAWSTLYTTYVQYEVVGGVVKQVGVDRVRRHNGKVEELTTGKVRCTRILCVKLHESVAKLIIPVRISSWAPCYPDVVVARRYLRYMTS